MGFPLADPVRKSWTPACSSPPSVQAGRSVNCWTTLAEEFGETEIARSSISVIELEHGLHRAGTTELAQKRRDYLDTVFAAIPVCQCPLLAVGTPRSTGPLPRPQQPPVDVVGFRVGLDPVFQVERHPAAGTGGVADARE